MDSEYVEIRSISPDDANIIQSCRASDSKANEDGQ